MKSSKLIRLSTIFFLLIILIFLWTKYNRYWIHLPSEPPPKYPCSFDHISACQTLNMMNRTFLYIIWGGAGFCSELNQVLLAFAYSVATKRHFFIDSQTWNYGYFTDYFNLPSRNNYSQFNRTFLVENNRQNDRIDHLKTTRVGTQVRQFWLATREIQSIPIKRRVAHYLWKSMTNETFSFIEACRIRTLVNYISIHIRKGDKLKKEAHQISLDKYIKGIERIFQINKSIQHIFVASDDHTVVKELRQLKPRWNFVSIYDHNYHKPNITGHFQSHFNRLSQKEKLHETRLFMCELQMLIDSTYVLCGMSSNVCRLIQILRHQHPSTAVSLDRPCHVVEWNVPVDIIDRYESTYHLSNTSSDDKFFCNCTTGYFGPRCEYSFDLPVLIDFKDVVYKQFKSHIPLTYAQVNITNVTCYHGPIGRECDRPVMCLDWRQICDGVLDCVNGTDERECLPLEVNECKDSINEYRCLNGRCIAHSFLFDKHDDCMDKTDEGEDVAALDDRCPWEPSVACEEMWFRRSDEFQCGHGGIVGLKKCVNSRDAIHYKNIF